MKKCLNCNVNNILKHNKYCSRSCYFEHKYIRTHPEINCFVCKTPFRRALNRIKDKNFCSKKCSNPINRTMYTVTDEHRQKMSIIAKKLGYGKWAKGRKGNSGSIKKGQYSGSKHPNWKGGITPENTLIRRSDKYTDWRLNVFKRDNYRCQWCGVRGVKINADHIKPFALHKKDRFLLKNGRTLCTQCHKKRTSIQLSVMWKNQFAVATFSKSQ